MWQSGMSATAIRRALGLNAEAALAAGIIAPGAMRAACGAARQGGGGRISSPPGRRPNGVRALRPGGDPARETARSSQAGPAMISVLKAVAQVSNIPPAHLLGPSQRRGLVRPRHLIMYLVRELCAGASLPAIGHFLGRDHTTVLYGCRRAEALLAKDAGVRRWRDGALQLLKQVPGGGARDRVTLQ